MKMSFKQLIWIGLALYGSASASAPLEGIPPLPTWGPFYYDLQGGHLDTEVIISGLAEPLEHVQIPAFIHGWPVVAIKHNAFSGDAFITSVSIPGTVKSIGRRAFANCSNLTEIVIPDSITGIGWVYIF